MTKCIEMKVTRCGSNGWVEDGTEKFYRVSRWIKVQNAYNPSKRNSLAYYIQDGYGYKLEDDRFDPENNGGPYLDFFRWNGRTYATEQFYSLGNPFWMPVTYSWEENGKVHYLSGVDMDGSLYNPIYIEFDECCEYLRVYERA